MSIRRFPGRRRFFIAVLAVLAASCTASDEAEFRAVDGVLDLREADIVGDTLPLDGEWRFAWMEFLSPDSEVWTNPGLGTAGIPSAWKDVEIGGASLPDTGYCTMRLQVLLPPTAGELGIKVNNVGTAYRLYADEDLILENGRIGRSREESEASYQPRTVYFESDGDEIALTMQISNFHDRMGGAWTRMYVGDAEGISKRHYADGSIDMLLFGMFVIIGIYYLIIWRFGGKDRAFLWFGLASLMIALRTLSAGEIYLMSIFPRLAFEINHKIQLSSQPALVSFLLLSLRNLYPEEISKTAAKGVLGIMIPYGIAIWAVPLIVHSYLLLPFQLVVAALGFYISYGVFRASRCERPGAKLLFIGFLLLFMTTINDILYSTGSLRTGYFLTLGIVAFSIAFVTALTMNRTGHEPLSEDLADARIAEALRDKGVSNRESEVVHYLLRGHTYDEIADELCIAKSTVTKHVHSVYRKLGTKNRVGLYESVKRLRMDLL